MITKQRMDELMAAGYLPAERVTRPNGIVLVPLPLDILQLTDHWLYRMSEGKTVTIPADSVVWFHPDPPRVT